MDFEAVFNSKFNIVSVRATGELNNETEALIVENALKVAAKEKCKKIFFDYSKMKDTATMLEIYESPLLYDLWGVSRNFRIAVFYSGDEKNFKFWETRMHNVGFIARIFRKEDEAFKWLINNTSY